MQKTKIIATLGPATGNEQSVRELVRAGVSGFRVNFSHGNSEQWLNFVRSIEKAESYFNIKLAIIGDLQGPNARLGKLCGDVMEIKKGSEYIFLNHTFSEKKDELPVPVAEFFEVLEVGDVIELGDSMIPFKVVRIDTEKLSRAVGVALESGIAKSRMAIGIKGKEIPIPYVTEKDIDDVRFALRNGFSHLMISFVRSAEDIESIKKIIKSMNVKEIKILAKLETSKAIINLKEIAKTADGLVIARGDLGKVFPLETLPKLQEEIVATALQNGKPIYVATQLLTSMIESPVPTRSEITDVYISAKLGVDGIILTNETSVGKYPIKAVEWAKKVLEQAEKGARVMIYPDVDELSWKFGKGIVEINNILDSTLLLFSLTGKSMRIIAAYRPNKPFFTGSPNVDVLRECSIIYGCFPVYINTQNYDDGLERLKDMLKLMGMVQPGSLTVSSYKFSTIDKQKIMIEKI